MSAKDVYHDTVKTALQKAAWVITHDPLVLEFSSGRLSIAEYKVKLLVFDPDQEEIVIWND